MILKKFAMCDDCGIIEKNVAMVYNDDCTNCGAGVMKIIVAVDCENPEEADAVEKVLRENFKDMQQE